MDVAKLRPRQLEMARLVARGLTDKEIAERMGIGLNTVKVYLSNIYQLLGLRWAGANRVRLALWTLVHDGLLDGSKIGLGGNHEESVSDSG